MNTEHDTEGKKEGGVEGGGRKPWFIGLYNFRAYFLRERKSPILLARIVSRLCDSSFYQGSLGDQQKYQQLSGITR